MMSLIEVTCPHCGAHGQIMLPPVGNIIIGPCPECRNPVLVFLGNVLKLNPKVIANGTPAQKQDHLLEIMQEFLHGRIAEMIPNDDGSAEPATQARAVHNCNSNKDPEARDRESLDRRGRITKGEMQQFIALDLSCIDNADYFRRHFGPKK